ncbi:MAG TPA: alpha/beta fold hydrolase [Bacillota bacterium]|jgi:fermentation-respiration switch protein FrsA (DUF1100 family)|nr:alpha/beta fold hydrolase [Bacillota bacterium]HQE10611.1 alpha/beta fold hydrolase [Bacillota bacterium]
MEVMGWRKEVIVNPRGVKLAALLREAEAAGKGDGAAPAGGAVSGKGALMPPLVIVCHGFTGSKEGGGGALDMADQLAGRGFATLLFDFTGCGESEGAWEEITLSRQVEDLGAVVDWAYAKGYRRIILNGRSFGGATVLAYAAADRQIDAVCTWAAVARPLPLFSGFAGKEIRLSGPPGERIALNDGTGLIYVQKCLFQDLQHYDLPACAARIVPRPLLLIHGAADELVPVSDAQLLYEAAGEPKELALVENADHRFTCHREQVWDIFFRWLQALFP